MAGIILAESIGTKTIDICSAKPYVPTPAVHLHTKHP